MKVFKKGPFKGLPKRHFKAIVLDPPWLYSTWSDNGKDRSPEVHYDCMTLEDLKALPVKKLAAPDCVFFMWVIDTHVPQAIELLEAWGLKYKTVAFYWVKTNKDDKTPFTGMGHWTRANPEQCWAIQDADSTEEPHQALLATIGKPSRVAKDVKRLIMSRRREHSRKPDELFERVEALVEGPYLELFARQSRPNWVTWGNEVNKFDDPVVKESTKYVDDIMELLG